MAKNKKEKVKAADITEKASKKKKVKAVETPAVKPVEKPKRPAVKKPVVTVDILTISDSDIALRAYYIAEDRARNGHHGDEAGDWVEAERQLRKEALKKK